MLLKALSVISLMWLPISHAEPSKPAVHYSVLAYHDLIDESDPALKSILPILADTNLQLGAGTHAVYRPQSIALSTLIKHFNWLKENGYTPVRFQQVIDASKGGTPLPDKAVVLTFDDGYENFYRLVYPLLKLYNFPATQAIVTSWIEMPEGSLVPYGNTSLPRSTFLTWPEIKEMQASGLVEIASHTHSMHKSVISNPFKGQQAALLSSTYDNGIYETPAQYRARIRNDFKQSAQLIQAKTGVAPKIMVWPYGQFNDVDVELARDAGFTHFFSLDDAHTNVPSDLEVGRLLMEEETSLATIKEYLTRTFWTKPTQRVVHVDMDYVYDANPVQLNKNLDALIERIKQYGVSTVYLQAYSDPDGNGVADALYFPNRHLPVRADLMNRVAGQLMTRSGVSVYAWMPMLAFNLGEGFEYVTDARTQKPSTESYLRLSPYSEKNRRIIQEIYQDLGFYSKFDGILFHDDGFLTDFEGPIGTGARTSTQMNEEASRKTQDLIDFTQTLKNAAGQYQRGGIKRVKTARNIYASVITDDEAQKWFAQSLQSFTQAYDYTAVMAMPYMEHEHNITPEQANLWLGQLADLVKRQAHPERIVFELQALNWRTRKPIPDAEMITWMNTLKKSGIHNFGYYPDNFIENQPNAQRLHPVFSISTEGQIK